MVSAPDVRKLTHAASTPRSKPASPPPFAAKTNQLTTIDSRALPMAIGSAPTSVDRTTRPPLSDSVSRQPTSPLDQPGAVTHQRSPWDLVRLPPRLDADRAEHEEHVPGQA